MQEVLRQRVVRQPLAVEKIAVHHDNVPLGVVLLRRRAVDRCPGAHQRDDRDVAGGAQLAGKAHVGRRMDALQRRPLIRRCRQAVVLARRHLYPAGRAARPPAAHGGMRQMEGAARLQDRPAARYPHGASGIGDRDEPSAAVLEKIAHRARGEGRADQGKITDEQSVVPTRDAGALGGMRRAQKILRRRGGGGIGGKLAAHGNEAEGREHRQQQRNRKQHKPRAPVPRPPIEGKMQAEAAVDPARRQQAELHSLRIRRPEIGDDIGVIRLAGRKLRRRAGCGQSD